MLDQWYDEWAQRHAVSFALTEAELAAVLSWKEVFLVSGYTSKNLNEATDYLVANPGRLAALAYAGKMPAHLSAIQARIREAIAVTHAREREDLFDHDRGTCTRCGGSGTVKVPHLKGVKDGEWLPQAIARGGASYYTMAVRCNCALGNWWHDRMTDTNGQKVMGLDRYAQLNPRWEIQLEKRKQQQLKLAEIEGRFDQSTAKRQLDETMERLRKEFGLEESNR